MTEPECWTALFAAIDAAMSRHEHRPIRRKAKRIKRPSERRQVIVAAAA